MNVELTSGPFSRGGSCAAISVANGERLEWRCEESYLQIVPGGPPFVLALCDGASGPIHEGSFAVAFGEDLVARRTHLEPLTSLPQAYAQ